MAEKSRRPLSCAKVACAFYLYMKMIFKMLLLMLTKQQGANNPATLTG
jgi:hypothetical protein